MNPWISVPASVSIMIVVCEILELLFVSPAFLSSGKAAGKIIMYELAGVYVCGQDLQFGGYERCQQASWKVTNQYIRDGRLAHHDSSLVLSTAW